MLWGVGSQPNVIAAVHVAGEDRRRGIATAMLQAARLLDPDLKHSTSLSEDGRAWADVAKHEGGGHDQKSHGNWARGRRAQAIREMVAGKGALAAWAYWPVVNGVRWAAQELMGEEPTGQVDPDKWDAFFGAGVDMVSDLPPTGLEMRRSIGSRWLDDPTNEEVDEWKSTGGTARQTALKEYPTPEEAALGVMREIAAAEPSTQSFYRGIHGAGNPRSSPAAGRQHLDEMWELTEGDSFDLAPATFSPDLSVAEAYARGDDASSRSDSPAAFEQMFGRQVVVELPPGTKVVDNLNWGDAVSGGRFEVVSVHVETGSHRGSWVEPGTGDYERKVITVEQVGVFDEIISKEIKRLPFSEYRRPPFDSLFDADEGELPLIVKHEGGGHDQKTHGNWARGGVPGGSIVDGVWQPGPMPKGYLPEYEATWDLGLKVLKEHPELFRLQIMADDGLPVPKGPDGEEPGVAYGELDGLTDDEKHGAMAVSRAINQAWEKEIQNAIALGKIEAGKEFASWGHRGRDDSSPAFERWKYDSHPESEDWDRLPDVLYHVTSARDAVLATGLKTRSELEDTAGLGGGTDEAISFTTDPVVATAIVTGMHELRRVVRDDDGTAVEWMRSQAASWDWEDRSYYDNAFGPQVKVEDADDRASLYQTFSSWREHHTGQMDPLFWGIDTEAFANLDLDQVAVLTIKPKPGAMGWQLGGMREWRTSTGQAVEVVDVAADIDRDGDGWVREGTDEEQYVGKHEGGGHDQKSHGNWATGGRSFPETLEEAEDEGLKATVAEVIEHYDLLDSGYKTDSGGHITADLDGNYVVVSDEGDGETWVVVHGRDLWDIVYSGGVDTGELEDELREDWLRELKRTVVYHGTTEDHLESIREEGLQPRNETRGIENRYVGAAVYTTPWDEGVASSYGEVLIEVDLPRALADGVISPDVLDREPGFFRDDALSAVAAAVEDYEFIPGDSVGGEDPSTVVIHDAIPPQYLTVDGERLAKHEGRELTLASTEVEKFNPYHDAEGKFTTAGNAVTISGPVKYGSPGHLAALTRMDGGLTFNPKRGNFARKGFAVAVTDEAEEVYPVDPRPGEDWAEEGVDIVKSYLQRHADLLAQPNAHLGTWIDEGKVYLDVSVVVQDPGEAAEISARTDQIAFFDLGTFTEWRKEGSEYEPVGKGAKGPVIYTPASQLDSDDAIRKLVEHLLASAVSKHEGGGHDQKTHGNWAIGRTRVSEPVGRIDPHESAGLFDDIEVDFGSLPGEIKEEVDLILAEEGMSREMIQRNYDALFAAAMSRGPEHVEKAAAWYPEANQLAAELAAEVGVTAEQMAAVIAATSQNQEWEQNQRIARRLTRFLAEDTPLDLDDRQLATLRKAVAKRTGLDPESINAGTRPTEVDDPMAVALMYGAMNSAHGWRSGGLYGPIAQGVAILAGESPDTALHGSKIRSFYNNIQDPTSHRDLTIDTHMFRAGFAGLANVGVTDISQWKVLEPNAISRFNSMPKLTRRLPGHEDDPKDIVGTTPRTAPLRNIGRIEVGTKPAFATAIRNISERTGLTPNAVQALIWIEQKERMPQGTLNRIAQDRGWIKEGKKRGGVSFGEEVAGFERRPRDGDGDGRVGENEAEGDMGRVAV